MQKPKGYDQLTDRDQQKEYLKGKLTEYVQRITTRDPKKKQFYKCPFCGDDDHVNSSNGAFSIAGDKVTWRCFSCQPPRGGDIFDLIGYQYGYDNFKDQFAKACELFGLDPDFKPTQADQPQDNEEKEQITVATTDNLPEGLDPYNSEDMGVISDTESKIFAYWYNHKELTDYQEQWLKKYSELGEYSTAQEFFTKQLFLDDDGSLTSFGHIAVDGYESYTNSLNEQPAAPSQEQPAGGTFKDYLEQCRQACTEGSRGYEYLISRGFTPETVNRCDLGYDAAKDVVTIPYGKTYSYYITRSIEGKTYLKPPKETAGAEPLYNAAALSLDQCCFVCESPLDAISILQAGGAAIAIGGTGGNKLVKKLQDQDYKHCLILCLDNDSAGQAGQKELTGKLDELGAPYIEASFSLDQYPEPKKDANDLLRGNADLLSQDITNNLKRAREYELEHGNKLLSVGAYKDLFRKHRTEQKQRISTGYTVLDRTLYGGFMDELYILSADTSAGKSAISCAIAQNIAASGVDVLYYCLEMGRDEFIARGISSISREYNEHPIPYGEILNYSWDERAQEFYRRPFSSYEQYLDEYIERYGEHLYYIEGGFYGKTALQIAEDVENFKKEHGIKQLVVFVDYLQRLKAEQTDRAQRDATSITSAAVQVLGNLASQKHNTVIAISSISNAQKGQKVTDAAGKYSGDISYTGGILLGWNWHGYTDVSKEADRAETARICKERGYREMYLEVLKQRSGDKDEKLTLFYYPAYNFFAVPDLKGKAKPKGGKR